MKFLLVFVFLIISVLGDQNCNFVDDVRMDDYIHMSVKINKFNNMKNNLRTDILLKNNPEVEYLKHNSLEFNHMCGSYIINKPMNNTDENFSWINKLPIQEKTLDSWQEVLLEYINILSYIKTGNETSFSRKEIIKCSGNTYLEDKLFYLVNKGISKTEDFTMCKKKSNKTLFESCYETPIYDRHTIMHILQERPVLTFIDIEQFDTRYYSHGILNAVNTKENLFPVIIMGYGYDELYNTEYWIIYNYLKNWGNYGIGYLNRRSYNTIPVYWLEI